MKYKLQLEIMNNVLSKCNLKEGKRNVSIHLFIRYLQNQMGSTENYFNSLPCVIIFKEGNV